MDNQVQTTSTEGQVVSFYLSDEEFGIPIEEVQEIVKPSAITKIPNAPEYVKGIANLRGNVLPVMDLRTRLGMSPKEEDENTRVIVLNVEDRTTGLVVDSVSEVLHVEEDNVDIPPDMLQSFEEKYLKGVARTGDGKRITLILETKAILPEKIEGGGSPGAVVERKNTDSEEEKKISSEEELLVTFRMYEEEFAVEIVEVKEIIRVGEITRVPKAPAFVKGITSLREMLLPIVDLGSLLGFSEIGQHEHSTGSDGENENSNFSIKNLEQADLGDARRIVVIDLDGIPIGILVDSVSEVLRLPKSSIDDPPATINRDQRSKLKGVARLDEGNRLVMLLDIKNLLSRDQETILADLGDQGKENGEDMSKDAMDEQQVVCFRVQEEEYGIDIMKVQEIIRISEITSVPNAPKFVEGIVNLRGNVLPVIDMRTRFGIDRVERTEQNRIIVVDISGKTTGIIVDSVSEVLRIPRGQIEPPPEVVKGNTSYNGYLNGIGKLDNGQRIIMLVNVDTLLDVKEDKGLSSIGGLKGAATEPAPSDKENKAEVNETEEIKEKKEATSTRKKKSSAKRTESKPAKTTKKASTKNTSKGAKKKK